MTKTIAGQKEIVELVAERADLEHDFDPFEEGNNNVSRIIMCVEYILPIFNVSWNLFIVVFVTTLILRLTN